MKQVKILFIIILSNLSFFTQAQGKDVINIKLPGMDDMVLNKDEATLDVFELIMTRIAEEQKKVTLSYVERDAEQFMSLLDTLGAFTDINYADRGRTNWTPLIHFDRLKRIALAYTLKNSKYYGDTLIYNSLVTALQFWYERNPQSDNWWMQKIATPQRMGVLLIILHFGEPALPTDLLENLLRQMADMGGDFSEDESSSILGANKLDVATHWIYRGCLSRDKAVLEKGVEQAFASLTQTNGEGLQYDWSYQQHGPQLYIGGYGNVLVNGTINLARYLRDTPYALSDNKLRILTTFIRSTFLPAIRGSNFMYNVVGRSLTRLNGLNQSDFWMTLEELIKLDSANVEVYKTAQSRLRGEVPAEAGITPKHYHYWLSDYTLHQRPSYTFDVRLSSKRTYRSEIINEENLLGYFLTDGATCLVKSGKEYANIFPLWDWTKVPGTTAPALQASQIPQPRPKNNYGKNPFAGGLTIDDYGVTGFHLQNKQQKLVKIEGKKAWFFFDQEIVCLGNDIRYKVKNKNVYTTIEQCYLSGDATMIMQNGDMQTIVGNNTINTYRDSELRAVYHGGNGYYFPEGGDIIVSMLRKEGNWNFISPVNREASGDLFTLYINHGETPSNGGYCYYLIPGIQSAEHLQAYQPEISVLSNTSDLQAVIHQKLSLLGVVFYAPGSFTFGQITIKSNRACVMMIKDLYSSEPTIAIADPTHKLKEVLLEISLPAFESMKQVRCTLPTENGYTGSTVIISDF